MLTTTNSKVVINNADKQLALRPRVSVLASENNMVGGWRWWLLSKKQKHEPHLFKYLQIGK